jgi:hypothetical protein
VAPQRALHIAATFGWHLAARKLTERGEDVCFKDGEGRTAVACAQSAGHAELAEYLQHVADLAMLNKARAHISFFFFFRKGNKSSRLLKHTFLRTGRNVVQMPWLLRGRVRRALTTDIAHLRIRLSR